MELAEPPRLLVLCSLCLQIRIAALASDSGRSALLLLEVHVGLTSASDTPATVPASSPRAAHRCLHCGDVDIYYLSSV